MARQYFSGRANRRPHSREPRLPHTTICQIPQKLLRLSPPTDSLIHSIAKHNPSPWVKFTDLSPVPARSSLRPPKLSPRRNPRSPRAAPSSASSTPDDSSTSPSLVARER